MASEIREPLEDYTVDSSEIPHSKLLPGREYFQFWFGVAYSKGGLEEVKDCMDGRDSGCSYFL